jgi:enoyl-CoA hydratase/carnithine racemase
MQCDLRILAVGGRYGFVHVRRGVIPDAHAHWTVPRAVGFAHAADLLLTGRHFTAEEAVAMGLASRAVPPADVLPAVLAVHRHVMGQADAREGVLAYLERREPRWSLSPTGDWPPDW